MDQIVGVFELTGRREVEVTLAHLNTIDGLYAIRFQRPAHDARLAMNKLGPALIFGNTVVVKPAPTTPLTTLLFEEICAQVLPAGVIITPAWR